MYASLVTASVHPKQAAEAIRLYREQVIPTVRQHAQGYRGMYVLTDSNSGQGLTIVLYDTEADAQLVQTSGQYAAAVATLGKALAGTPTREVREVTIHDRPGTPRVARVSDIAGSPDRFGPPGSGGGQVTESAAQQPGYAGFLIAIDRTSGQATGMSFWEDQEALAASEQAYYQPQVVQAATAATPLRRRVMAVSAYD